MSGARPDTWMPFYIGDYLGDTMHLSTAQHGAYLLLIFAYWRRGRALPDDDSELSAICRVSVKDWFKGFRSTLARFFRVTDGTWWHQRVEDELAKAARNIARASAGGEAKAAKAAASKQATSTPQADTKQDVGTNGADAKLLPQLPSPSPLPQASLPPSPPKRGADDSPEFSAFWKAFPHRVGKPTARRALENALKTAPLVDILAGLERYIANKPAERSWLNPATFLRQERWNDQPASAGANGSSPAPMADAERWRVRLAHWRRTKEWPDYQGPKPGEIGCQVPDELLTDAERFPVKQTGETAESSTPPLLKRSAA